MSSFWSFSPQHWVIQSRRDIKEVDVSIVGASGGIPCEVRKLMVSGCMFAR